MFDVIREAVRRIVSSCIRASVRYKAVVRQAGDVRDHTFAIRFLEPGVQAYAFTFG
jgi:hypothetical protein